MFSHNIKERSNFNHQHYTRDYKWDIPETFPMKFLQLLQLIPMYMYQYSFHVHNIPARLAQFRSVKNAIHAPLTIQDHSNFLALLRARMYIYCSPRELIRESFSPSLGLSLAKTRGIHVTRARAQAPCSRLDGFYSRGNLAKSLSHTSNLAAKFSSIMEMGRGRTGAGPARIGSRIY